jgi:hypothetical protein
MYEFVQKLAKKKICIRVGISTRDQYGLLSSQRHIIHHPASSISAHFIYNRTKELHPKNEIVKIHPCNI